MNVISITGVYDLLAVKLGKETAETLTGFIDNKIDQGLESKTETFATKANIFAVKENICAVKEDIRAVKIELFAVKADLIKEISKVESRIGDSIKWMFVFWLGQAVAIISLFFKK